VKPFAEENPVSTIYRIRNAISIMNLKEMEVKYNTLNRKESNLVNSNKLDLLITEMQILERWVQ
jgi:hypothetical protein